MRRSIHRIRARARSTIKLGATVFRYPIQVARQLRTVLSAISLQPDPKLRARVLALFRPTSYLALYPDVGLEWLGTPFEHYKHYGRAQRRDICMLFDSAWYRTQFPGLGSHVSAIDHYLAIGAAQGADPSPVFDTAWYLRQVGAALPAHCTPLEHYMTLGWMSGLDPHPLFSSAWYIERSPHVVLGALTPYEHFLEHGGSHNSEPGPMFIPSAYRNRHSDIEESNRNSFVHYVRYGLSEQRVAISTFDSAWYSVGAAEDPLLSSMDPLTHFVRSGAHIGRDSHPDPIAAALAKHRLQADRRSRSSFTGTVTADHVGQRTNVATIEWERRLAALDVPQSDSPLVSVVMPTHNHFEDVVRCMESIAGAGDSTPLEVIIVDDASEDLDASRLPLIRGTRTVRLDKNRGFAGAVEAGLAGSLGEFVMLLNNDTEVLPGWIDALVAEMHTHPRTGVVGCKIVRRDLLLQEAGCIVWSDGSAFQYGSGQSPFDFRYNFRREVDYCSGAALLVRRALWDDVGGFDERFSPAYYEDADLCFTARERGYAVVVEPASIVFHMEGTSHGTDGSGAKHYQYRNKGRFRNKWEVALLSHSKPLDPNDGSALIRLRERRRSHHAIVMDHRLPMPDHDAGSARMFRLLEGLIERDYVVHFVPANGARVEPAARDLELLGVEVVTGEDIGRHLSAIGTMADFILLSRPDVFAQMVSTALALLPTVPLVFDMVDAHALRLRRSAVLLGRPELEVEADRYQRIEARAARISDVVVTVSQEETEFITGVAKAPLRTVCIPTVHFAQSQGPGFEGRTGLLFVGGFEHPPNVDAALYLVHEVLPMIRCRISGVQLILAGSRPPPVITELRVDGVTVTGWLPDLRPLYYRARVSVAPMRFGAGVKGKIGEALSFGLPTITTTLGIEGMNVLPGRDILIGDTPEQFADRVAEAYLSRPVWDGLRMHGAQAIDQQFGREATNARIDELLEAVAAASSAR